MKNSGNEIEGWTPDASLSSIRIVLLGKSGVGKSAAGNTILGWNHFTSAMKMNAVTRECSDKNTTVSGRSVSVVDTPGFFGPEMKPEELTTEIARSVYLSSPGPHAILIVFRINDRFTEHEQQIPQQIEELFGQEVLKYSIILFTYGDLLDDEPIDEFIKENRDLRHVVRQCGGRYHVFSNKDLNNRVQVNELLKKIDTMVEQNGGGYYSNQVFEDAHKFKYTSGFNAFCSKHWRHFIAAAVGAGIVAPLAAGAAAAVATGAAVAAVKGFIGGAVGGAVVGAVGGAVVKSATQRTEQERKQQ